MPVSLFNSRRSPVYASKYTLPDFAGDIRVHVHTNALRYITSGDLKPLQVVTVNHGICNDQRVRARTIKSLVRTATADNQPIEVISYSDPLRPDAYAPQHRIRRFGKVVLAVAQRHAQTGTRQQVVGHSWSWPDTVKVTAALHKEARIAKAIGITPTGHPPASNQWGMGNLLRGLAAETQHLSKDFTELGSVATAGWLAASMVGRFVLAPRRTVREVARAFRDDITDQTIALQKDTAVETVEVLAGLDGVVPQAATYDRLIAAGFPDENINTVDDMTHLSAVTNAQYGALLYQLAV